MNFVQRAALQFLRVGRVPQHVGVIMDGNRRFAKERNMQPTDGHLQGYQSFLNLLEWGQKIGINELTVFAFSIENYNRRKEEVQFLLHLMKSKLDHLQNDLNFIDRNEVQVKVCGDLQLLEDEELKNSFKQIEQHSSKYNKYKLNICFSYNFTNEIEKAIKSMPQNLNRQQFLAQLNSYLMISSSPDLLLRTSGETRLSNFMLHQIREKTVIHFLDKKWPELSFLDFCQMILFYRQNI